LNGLSFPPFSRFNLGHPGDRTFHLEPVDELREKKPYVTNGEDTVLVEDLLPVPAVKEFNPADYNVPAETPVVRPEVPSQIPGANRTPFKTNQERALSNA